MQRLLKLVVATVFFLPADMVLADININGQAKKMQLEQLTSDPATCSESRVYWDSDDNLFRLCDGSSWLSIATSASAVVNPMNGASDMMYGAAAGVVTELNAGTAGTILMANGAAAPTWTNTITTGKFINGSADEVQLRIEGAAGQTVDTLLIESDGGADLFRVSNSGSALATASMQATNFFVTSAGVGKNNLAAIKFWRETGASACDTVCAANGNCSCFAAHAVGGDTASTCASTSATDRSCFCVCDDF